MISARDRLKGAWWGAFVGDALAMPVHGYPSKDMVEKDYGYLTEMQAPKEPYSTFVLAGYNAGELKPEFDYMGDKRREDWKHTTTHPHKHLQAGDNTLSMYLALHMAASIAQEGEFKIDSWLTRYHAIMTAKEGYHDTFIPSIHRRYFENMSAGKDPEKNGVAEAHISDVAIFLPLYLYGYKNPVKEYTDLLRIMKKFSSGQNTANTSIFLLEIFTHLINGVKLEEVLYQKMTPDRHYALAYPYRRWIKAGNSDEAMAVEIGRTAELEKAIVLGIYLALKYQDDYESAMLANVNMGGETTGRGSLVGSIIAAQHGIGAIPSRWLDALGMSAEIAGCGNALMQAIFK